MTRLSYDQKIICMGYAIQTIGTGNPMKTVKDVGGTIEKVYTKIVSLIEGDEDTEKE